VRRRQPNPGVSESEHVSGAMHHDRWGAEGALHEVRIADAALVGGPAV
jgi:hypothetical protein